ELLGGRGDDDEGLRVVATLDRSELLDGVLIVCTRVQAVNRIGRHQNDATAAQKGHDFSDLGCGQLAVDLPSPHERALALRERALSRSSRAWTTAEAGTFSPPSM